MIKEKVVVAVIVVAEAVVVAVIVVAVIVEAVVVVEAEVSRLLGQQSLAEIQKIVLIGTSHIRRKVLSR